MGGGGGGGGGGCWGAQRGNTEGYGMNTGIKNRQRRQPAVRALAGC